MKMNWRPLRALPEISKFFERLMHEKRNVFIYCLYILNILINFCHITFTAM